MPTSKAPWEDIVPGLAYRTALRTWWGLPEDAAADVAAREALQGIREAELVLPDAETARIFDQERAHWWLTHEGFDPVSRQVVDDLNAHVGRPIAAAGVVPRKRPKPAEPAQGRLL